MNDTTVWVIRSGDTHEPLDIKLTYEDARRRAAEMLSIYRGGAEFAVNNAWNISVYVLGGKKMPLEIVQARLTEVVTRNKDLLSV